MRLQRRSHSKISLTGILSRRRKSLKNFLQEFGIVSYESLKMRCDAMGVQAPTEQEFVFAMGNPILPELSSPTEGVVVILPADDKVIVDESRENEDPSSPKNASIKKKKKSTETPVEPQ